MWKESKERIKYVVIGWIQISIIEIKNIEYIIYGIYRKMSLKEEEEKIYNIEIMETMEIIIKIVIEIGIIGIIPLIWIEIYGMIAGGLKKKEKREILKIMIIMWIMLIIGIWISEEYIIRNIERYINGLNKEIIGIKIENIGIIKKYYEFIEEMIGLMIIITQIPVIMYIMASRIKEKGMKEKRRKVNMGIIIISGIISPPEIWNQIIIYVVVVGIYEIWLWKEIERKYEK